MSLRSRRKVSIGSCWAWFTRIRVRWKVRGWLRRRGVERKREGISGRIGWSRSHRVLRFSWAGWGWKLSKVVMLVHKVETYLQVPTWGTPKIPQTPDTSHNPIDNHLSSTSATTSSTKTPTTPRPYTTSPRPSTTSPSNLWTSRCNKALSPHTYCTTNSIIIIKSPPSPIIITLCVSLVNL